MLYLRVIITDHYKLPSDVGRRRIIKILKIKVKLSILKGKNKSSLGESASVFFFLRWQTIQRGTKFYESGVDLMKKIQHPSFIKSVDNPRFKYVFFFIIQIDN